MKAHLINADIMVLRSKSSAKVKVKYQGHVSQKMGVLGELVFHKHILFFFTLLPSISIILVIFNDNIVCKSLEFWPIWNFDV